MDSMQYSEAPQGLHVRPALPPRQPSTAWKVIKWLVVVGVMVVCVLSVFFNMILSAGFSGKGARDAKVVELHVSGPSGYSVKAKVAVVTAHAVILGDEWAGSSAWIIRQLDHAAADQKVKAVILDVDSPGGGITACDLIHERILKLQGTGKTVIVLMRNVAASGGYYISAPADHIIAHPTTITGSIGVIIGTYNVEGLFEKIGIRSVVFKSGDKKDILSGTRPMEEDEKALIQQITLEMFERFKDVVKDGRGLSEEEIEPIVDGRIITASRALELKLIDEIGYFEDAEKRARKAAGASAEVVRYITPPSLAQALFAGRSSSLERLTTSVERMTDVLEPGFYYMWPGP